MIAHGGSEAMKQAGGEMRDLLAGKPDLQFLEVVGGKNLPG